MKKSFKKKYGHLRNARGTLELNTERPLFIKLNIYFPQFQLENKGATLANSESKEIYDEIVAILEKRGFVKPKCVRKRWK